MFSSNQTFTIEILLYNLNIVNHLEKRDIIKNINKITSIQLIIHSTIDK